MISFLFLISVICFLAGVFYIVSLFKPGFYPPKKLLKKRAGYLFGTGIIILLITMLFNSLK